MARYNLRFYDYSLRDTHEITVQKDTICHLAAYLNDYVYAWGVEYVCGRVVNEQGQRIDFINFLPNEVRDNRFITTLEERLVAYANYFQN